MPNKRRPRAGSRSVDKRYVVISDQHMPFADQAAISCVLKAIGMVRPTGIINIGDVGEWEGASHWQWKESSRYKRKRPPLEVQLGQIDGDIAAVNAGLDEIDEACARAGVKEKHMIEGNHDDWMNQLVYENPFLKTTGHGYGTGYMFKDAVNLATRGYQYHPAGKLLKIGHLNLYHGHLLAGIDHCRNHLLRWGVNLMYGDKHDVQQRSVTHVGGEKSAWSIGCLKRFDHEANLFMARAPSNWGHAFAVVDFWAKGIFSVHVVRIIKGECSLWGKVINGNK
jgi:hypothetical protein